MNARHYRGLVAAVATLLATAPLAVLFDGLGWLVRSAIVVGLVAGAAAAARALRAPVWAQVAAMTAALTLALTWLFSSGHEILGLLPSAGTVEHFGALLTQMPADVRAHAAPVPELDSMLLVAVAGVGVVAVLVDLFAVGMRRPALAGLPMLAIYSVPVAVSLDSVPVLLFAVGAAGYLWMLGSDNMERVRRFGRRFTGDGRDVEAWEPSPLAAAGRRLAVIGVLVAVALPLAVPGMTSGLIDRFGGSLGPGSGPGGSGGTGQVNLFAELYGQLNHDDTVELVQVTTDDPDPFYLRLATADQITDVGFEPSPPSGTPVGELERGPGTAPGVAHQEHRAEVELTDAYAMGLAPTYAQLAGVNGLDSSWRYDSDQQVVYSDRSGVTPTSYAFDYRRPEYDAAALRRVRPLPAGHEIQEQFAHAPEVAEVRELLDGLVDPGDSPYDQVRSILDFFSRDNGFRYDLTTGPETDAPAIVDFLDNRSGFCVQYAAAMAWLVRSVDLPARVAFGFTRGRAADDDSRVLTNRNLHAWTEVYFDQFGWVPFDPTPGTAVAGSASPGWAPNPQAPPETDAPDSPDGNDDGAAPSPGVGTDEEDMFEDLNGGTGQGPLPGDTDSGFPWWGMAIVLAAAVLLAQPAMHRELLRRRRVGRRAAPAATVTGAGTVVSANDTAARHRAHQAWSELLDTMVDLRMPVDPTETPRVTVERLATQLQTDADAPRAVRLLGMAEERARYARTALSPEGLGSAVHTMRQALSGQALPRARMRAAVLPPSTLLRWRTATVDTVTRVMTVVNRLGESLGRLSPRRLLRAPAK